MDELTWDLVAEAHRALAGLVHRTPMLESAPLSAAVGRRVFLKLECAQVTGSFKVRGALFRLAALTPDERRRGIVTCSAGNHGKGVAYAAGRLGVDAEIHVPASCDAAKLAAMKKLGARVVVSDQPGYDETEPIARRVAAATGRPFVSAFDEPAIMAGNGATLALECLDQVPDARHFLLPVSGGGMAAGFAFVVKDRVPGCTFWCAQHRDSPGLALGLERGEAVTALPPIDTVAGGIEGGTGVRTFDILRTRTDHVALVSEAELRAGVRWMLAEHQLLIEPSSAVVVAALTTGRLPALPGNAPLVVVISGRNVAWDTVRSIVEEDTAGR